MSLWPCPFPSDSIQESFACLNDRACSWCPRIWINHYVCPRVPTGGHLGSSCLFYHQSCCTDSLLQPSRVKVEPRFHSGRGHCWALIQASVFLNTLAKLPFFGRSLHERTHQPWKWTPASPPISSGNMLPNFWILAKLIVEPKKQYLSVAFLYLRMRSSNFLYG